MVQHRLDRIVIEGYKSIRACDLTLGPLNVLVGPNGAGKSNFVSALGLLGAIVNGNLQLTVARSGGASTLLHGGPKLTEYLILETYFGQNGYLAQLGPGSRDELIFERESALFLGEGFANPLVEELGRGILESNLLRVATERPGRVADHCLRAMRDWKVFHFQDTSPQAAVKQKQLIDNNESLDSNAANLAPFLFRLRETDRDSYNRIVDSVRLVAPYFREFRLQPDRINNDRIQLEWQQVGSDGYFNGHALSDGTLRFICLSTLLLQPQPPSVIIIDEPELGLHPFAITQLAGMFRAATNEHQLIVSTQSVTLLNQLDLGEIVVVEQHYGESSFERPDIDSLQQWLSEYAIGELWEKNVLGGRPY